MFHLAAEPDVKAAHSGLLKMCGNELRTLSSLSRQGIPDGRNCQLLGCRSRSAFS